MSQTLNPDAPSGRLAQPRAVTRRAARRLRGMAVYLTVVSVSVMVAATGLTLIAVQRSDRRLQENIILDNKLSWYARSGIEMGLMYMERNTSWRQQVQGTCTLDSETLTNCLFEPITVSGWKVAVQVFDELDGNIANSLADPVRMVATGRQSGVSYKLECRLTPRPHQALTFAAFSGSSLGIQLKSTASVRGPIRAHGNITADSNVTRSDDASFETLSAYTISTNLSPRKFVSTTIPTPVVSVSAYQAMATAIQGGTGSTCELYGYNLTPTSNPTGIVNPNGIYWLDAGGRDVRIENLRVQGTLIITNVYQRVRFEKACRIEPGSPGFPSLLIDAPGRLVEINPDLLSVSELSVQLRIPGGTGVITVWGVD